MLVLYLSRGNLKKGLKRYQLSRKCRYDRRSVSFEILRRVLAQLVGLCSSSYEASLFQAAFSLAFSGAFRISKLVSLSKKVQGGMLAQEVNCREDRVSPVLRRSKMDQVGKGRKVQVFSVLGSPLCPVGAVKGFLAVRPELAGSFLIHTNGSPLFRFRFISVFRC